MTTTILHCANCQRRLPEGASYCPYCGYSVDMAVERQTNDPPTSAFAAPPGLRSGWQLMLVRPDGEQLSFPLLDRMAIGRSAENDLQLQDPQVSRFHAIVEKTIEGYRLTDLGSTNGTYLNRKRINEGIRLKLGDTVTIGQHRVMVQRESLRCGHCGQPVSSEYIFCTHCGEPLSGLPSGRAKPRLGHDIDLRPTDPLRLPPEAPAKSAWPPIPEALSAPSQTAQARPAVQPVQAPAPVLRQPAATPVPGPVQGSGQASATSAPRQGTATPATPYPVRAGTDMPSRPGLSQSRSRLFPGCAVAAVIGLCLLSTLAAVGYYLYTIGYLNF